MIYIMRASQLINLSSRTIATLRADSSAGKLTLQGACLSGHVPAPHTSTKKCAIPIIKHRTTDRRFLAGQRLPAQAPFASAPAPCRRLPNRHSSSQYWKPP